MRSESGTRELELPNKCKNPRCIEGKVTITPYEAYRSGKPYIVADIVLDCEACYGTFTRKLELEKE